MGVQTKKKPSVEGVWIFSGTTQFWKAVTHKRQTFTTESKFHFRYILITTSLPYLGAHMETFNWIDVSNGVQQILNKSVVEFLLDWGQVHQNNVFFFVREALFQDSLTPSTEAIRGMWVMTLKGRRGMGGDKGKGKMGWDRGSMNLPLPSPLSPSSYPLLAKQPSRDLDIQVSNFFFLKCSKLNFFKVAFWQPTIMKWWPDIKMLVARKKRTICAILHDSLNLGPGNFSCQNVFYLPWQPKRRRNITLACTMLKILSINQSCSGRVCNLPYLFAYKPSDFYTKSSQI